MVKVWKCHIVINRTDPENIWLINLAITYFVEKLSVG
jgi:hypothetical protein